MSILVAAARCRRHGHARLYGLLSGQLGQLGQLSPPPSAAWPALRQSCRGLQTKGPDNHDAKIEDIRNVGIIAHVDAGKTTTTERMLYYSGFSRHLGNVDHGDTITDFLPLERQRGITIQSAAITFNWPPRDRCQPGTNPRTINLIDTPGHQDFRFEVDRCLPILDGAVCIIDSVKGVEAHTERVWASAQEYSIPRIMFVNKLDRDGASFKRSVLDIASRLGSWPLVCQIPLWDKDVFVGVVDVVQRTGLRWSSPTKHVTLSEDALRANPALWEEIERARARLIERLCEDDDQLVEEFSERGNDVSAAAIKASIQRAIRSGDGAVVPVFAGASLKNMGIEPLLDAIIDYLPNPREAPDVDVFLGAEKLKLEEALARQDPSAKRKAGHAHHPPLSGVASVFKVVNDPYLFPGMHGMLTFVRVYHGALHKNSHVWNANLRAFEKPFNILQVSASKVSEIPYLAAGQIGAITGLKEARTGDTLHVLPSHSRGAAESHLKDMTIRPPEVGPAVAFVSVEPMGPKDTRDLEEALQKLSREDPSLRWSKDDKTDTFVLSGMGGLHLDIAIDRLKTTYQVKALFGDIQVDYKESLTVPLGPRHFVFDKDIANRPGRAACTATIEPLEEIADEEVSGGTAGETDVFERDGNVFRIQIVPSQSSSFDAELVRKQLTNGALAAMARGPRRGAPLHGCRVTLAFDPATDYSGPGADGHVVRAATTAVRELLREAHGKHKAVVVLEPVMLVRIVCPEESAGNVQHDISSARGGSVLEVKDRSATTVSSDDSGRSSIDPSQVYAPPDPYETVQSLREPRRGATRMLEMAARVPLREMLVYDRELRKMTAGRHSFTMEFDRFERVVGARERELDAL